MMDTSQLRLCQVFVCNICNKQSIEPVVTQCGHIFCWRCIYRTQNSICPICQNQLVLNNCYPIYIQHEQREDEGQNQYPPRPSPNYREKIINPGVENSNLPPGLINLNNNVGCKKRVAGISYNASMIVNSFNNIKEPRPTDKDADIFKFSKNISLLLCLLLMAVIGLILFLF